MKHEILNKTGGISKVSLTPLKAIRRFCMECMGFQAQLIKTCGSLNCPLHPYRMGRNPKRAGIGGKAKAA